MNPRQIFVFSDIDEYSAQFIISQLLAFDRVSNEPITMVINSPGGYVDCMFAIVDVMNALVSPVRTIVLGMAASAAALIAAAGDERLISENSQFMLHEASAMSWGPISDMQDSLAQSAKRNEKMFQLLSESTGQIVETLKSVTSKTDKFFSAQEAVQFGLADKVIGAGEAQALKLSEPVNVEGCEFSPRGDGLSEVQILKEGLFEHPAYGSILINDKNLLTMKSNFDNRVRGIDISINYTHLEAGEDPAAFWVKSLEIRTVGKLKGLFAVGEFTPMGRKKVSEKEYKYASADFLVDYVNEQGQHFPYVLRGGTLTNRPFIKEMNPIKLSEHQPTTKEKNSMGKEQLIAALKEQGIDVTALQTSDTSLKAEVADLKNKIRELSTLPAAKDTEIKTLKDKLSEISAKIVLDAKENAFNELVEKGKVIPAQKAGILATFDTAEKMETFYKDALPVVKTSASGAGGEGTDTELSEDEAKVVASGAATKEDILASRKPLKGTLTKKKKRTTASQ